MHPIALCAVMSTAAGVFCGNALAGVCMSSCGDAQVSTVQSPPGYNSWPMVQALGRKVVCAYSKGSAHTIDEGKRGVYARTSADGGRTWGDEVCIVDDSSVGEVTIGKGVDEDGAMLLWVRRWGKKKGHDLYRTADGKMFEKISSPSFSPMPMQVTDAFKVPGVGLMSLWFAGNYSQKESGHSWGTLTSADNGRTWTQHTVEDDLPKTDWPTEQSAVHLGGGRILAIARSEGDGGRQFQLTSTDSGKTWKRTRTNITDVRESTPSLIFDRKTGLVHNYYYQRGAKKLKRRVAEATFIFDHPSEWPAPEVLAEGAEKRPYDAGNVNATVYDDRHLLALYSGTDRDCAVFVVSGPVPKSLSTHTYLASFDIANQTATSGVVNIELPGVALLDSVLPLPGKTRRKVGAFRAMSPVDRKSLRLGRWRVIGECTTGNASLEEVVPVYETRNGLTLGEGETLFGRTYRYAARWSGPYGSESRPFAGFVNGYLHDSHWRMRKDGVLTWRHSLGGRCLKKGKLKVKVSHADTPWAVEAAVDGGAWRRLATFPKSDNVSVDLPDGKDIQVRVCGIGDKGFYVWGYSFEATIDIEPGYIIGRTDLRRNDGTVFVWPDAPEKPYAKGSMLASTDRTLRLWTAAAGWKVFPDNPLPADVAGAIRIQTAANETECSQLVVTPSRALSGVRVDVAGAPASAAATMPASAVEVMKVSCVDVKIPTDKTCAAGLWPDPIERQTADGCDIAADESRSFWVRVKPPKGTQPGIYRGSLEVRADGMAPQCVPLEVEVFGFELPDVMTCETAFGCRVRNLVRYCHLNTLADRRKMFDLCFRILADHHITVYDPDPTTPLKVEWKGLADPATAQPVFNWDEWDAAVEKGFREYHANTLRVPVNGLGGGTYEHRYEPEIAGFKEGTPEYDILIGRYLRALEGHLKEKGWLEKSYVYWFDEPDAKDYAFCTNGFAKLKRHAPGMRRMLTEEVCKTLLDSVNLWCPVTSNFHKGENDSARAKGDRFWWYVCCGPKAPYATEFIDKPGTEMRVWLWQTWKEKVSGVLIWDTIYWSGGSTYRGVRQDCWDDTQCWCDSERLPYPYNWGNGDGRFLYPPRSARGNTGNVPVLDPPVETYRLEMLRDGIEDYEYFAILRRLDPQNALLTVPPDVTASMTEFTRDPTPMQRHREKLAREIVRLGGKTRKAVPADSH